MYCSVCSLSVVQCQDAAGFASAWTDRQLRSEYPWVASASFFVGLIVELVPSTDFQHMSYIAFIHDGPFLQG